MSILVLRTDKPEAEIGLYDDHNQLSYETWPAHRQLAETIHYKIGEQLKTAEIDLAGIEGIVVYQGPGSFTGLRIGISVANALADGLTIPIVATTGDDWAQQGVNKLLHSDNDRIALPEYGAAPHITQQKK